MNYYLAPQIINEMVDFIDPHTYSDYDSDDYDENREYDDDIEKDPDPEEFKKFAMYIINQHFPILPAWVNKNEFYYAMTTKIQFEVQDALDNNQYEIYLSDDFIFPLMSKKDDFNKSIPLDNTLVGYTIPYEVKRVFWQE